MAKMGRPFVHSVDYKELKEMIRLGFTLEECSNYYSIPYQTLQFYARKFNLGKFKAAYRPGKYDDKILYLLETKKHTQIEAANIIGIPQGNLCRRYNIIIDYREREKGKQEWMRLKKATVDAVERN